VNIRFRGSAEQLNELLAGVIDGCWDKHNHGKHWQCKRADGAVLNWWPSTGTILCQGPISARIKLEMEIRDAFIGDAATEEKGMT
jgi:hypothetical protein